MTLEKRNAAFVAFWDCDGHRLCPEIVRQVAIEFAECCSEVLCVLWAAGALAQEAFSCRISTKVANRAVRHADGEGVSVREGNSKPQATKQGPSAQLSLAIGVERVRSTVRKLKGKLAGTHSCLKYFVQRFQGQRVNQGFSGNVSLVSPV